MASPISTSTGIGSGLKITEIVTALVDADKAAKQKQITTNSSKNTASLSGVSQLKSALAAFQATMTNLGSTTGSAFQGFVASSSNESLVKATADNTAVGGIYSIKVNQLATASKVATVAIDSAQASAIPSGNLTITQNSIDTVIKIDAGSTLQQVRDKINSEMQFKGISANIINDANGSRLVFSSSNTGAGSDISVKGSGDIGSLMDIDGKQLMSASGTSGNPGAGAIVGFAQDAKFSVDGLELTSSKNTVDKAISGLTFNLVAADPNKETVITLASNTDGIKASLQSFVDSYNTLVKLVTTLTKGSTAADGTFTAAALTGDSTPRNMLAAIRSQIAFASDNAGLGSLAQLGIRTQQVDGTLSLDSAKFSAAMTDKKMGSEIQKLFTSDTGLIKRISDSIEPYTKANGVLAQKDTSLNKIKTRLGNEQEALDRRVATLTETLTKKYNAMDLAVAKLKATASSITSIFDAINAQKNAS
ncbi:flagellar hook protein FliD [Pseudomonas sp. Leaf127]|uniref:flagellar filament capping protein FliD n=1 Tax=Pseudomonas sp. Leaf127 TaxID=1736267 RepID=UPI000703A239|nr:flagellar filament capping protein FliD [Pseudomonas sp. Leaf127]KQQ57119.1 flagellar hook protein FliD [Pseudomonas sp. Leaf127]